MSPAPLPTARFLALALPTAMLVLALAGFAAETLGLGPDLAPLAARGIGRPGGLPTGVRALALAFEATALVALYLLVRGRGAARLFDGVTAGLAAWLFRGPILVLSIAQLTRLPTDPFWQAARIELVALPVAGLAVAALARATRLDAGEAA